MRITNTYVPVLHLPLSHWRKEVNISSVSFLISCHTTLTNISEMDKIMVVCALSFSREFCFSCIHTLIQLNLIVKLFLFFFKSLLNFLQYCFCFIFWFLAREACGVLAPQPGIKPAPPALESKVLTTGPPWKSYKALSVV